MSSEFQHELEKLSKTPLHGVALQFAENTNPQVPYSVSVAFDSITPLNNAEQVWDLTDAGERYHSHIQLVREHNRYQLSIDCEGKGTFELHEDNLTIDWQPGGTGPAHYLQTLGISLYLELKGHLCLHANTLIQNSQAHLFLAPSRTGKSTLTSLLTTLGYTLTTDDMAALHQQGEEYMVYPSWAKVRLWPDSVELLKNQLTTTPLQQKKVHERFAKEEITFETIKQQTATPLKALYYLNRVEGEASTTEVTLTRIAPSAALIILMQNSMLGDAPRGLGIEKARITALAKLLQHIPFYKVSYPSGLDKLANVASQLDEKLQTL